MTVALTTPATSTDAAAAGATSRDAVDWHSINWTKAHRNVRRLQARIVQATQAGRWGKVNALQRLLTHSFSALRPAGYPPTQAVVPDQGH